MDGTVYMVLVIIVIVAIWAYRKQRDELFRAAPACREARGPYGMQLYDTPYYYPYYQAQADASRLQGWPGGVQNTRCVTTARPDGSTTWCR